jgi:hypothetical protein
VCPYRDCLSRQAHCKQGTCYCLSMHVCWPLPFVCPFLCLQLRNEADKPEAAAGYVHSLISHLFGRLLYLTPRAFLFVSGPSHTSHTLRTCTVATHNPGMCTLPSFDSTFADPSPPSSSQMQSYTTSYKLSSLRSPRYLLADFVVQPRS